MRYGEPSRNSLCHGPRCCVCRYGASYSSLSPWATQGVLVFAGIHGNTDPQDYPRGERGWCWRFHYGLLREGVYVTAAFCVVTVVARDRRA